MKPIARFWAILVTVMTMLSHGSATMAFDSHEPHQVLTSGAKSSQFHHHHHDGCDELATSVTAADMLPQTVSLDLGDGGDEENQADHFYSHCCVTGSALIPSTALLKVPPKTSAAMYGVVPGHKLGNIPYDFLRPPRHAV